MKDKLKGDSTTHIYTEKGRENYDKINWNSKKKPCKPEKKSDIIK